MFFSFFSPWSATLRDLPLMVFENKAQRRIFGLKREEITRELMKPHNEEPHNLHSSLNIMREINSRTGHASVVRAGVMRNF
jgi:hypothetical protein